MSQETKYRGFKIIYRQNWRGRWKFKLEKISSSKNLTWSQEKSAHFASCEDAIKEAKSMINTQIKLRIENLLNNLIGHSWYEVKVISGKEYTKKCQIKILARR